MKDQTQEKKTQNEKSTCDKAKSCKKAKDTLPASTPTSAGNVDGVSDPPVPNRARTPM